MIKKISIPMLLWSSSLVASNSSYDLDFINSEFGVPKLDESWIKERLSEGFHFVDVSLFDGQVSNMEIQFLDVGQGVEPCFREEQLLELGVRLPIQKKECFFVKEISEDANFRYISSQSRIELNIPGIALAKTNIKLKTSPKLWSDGIYSAKLNYNSYLSIDDSKNAYLGFNGGASLADWRVVGNGSVYYFDDGFKANVGDFYLYTDVDKLFSEFRLGEINTASNMDVNSSIPITGISLQLSEQMFNPKWSDYSPVIRGRINSSSAKVTVMDEERIVYSKIYATGEFEINELDLSSIGNELKLIIEESDGSVRTRIIPYAKLPNMLKSGSYFYSASLGNYRGVVDNNNDTILSAQIQYGFSNVTSGVNFLLADKYNFLELNNAFNLKDIGAFSVGLGSSNLGKNMGHYLQVSYAKYLKSTQTSIHFAGIEYRSKRFKTYLESIKPLQNVYQPKYTFELSLNQKIFDSMLYVGYRKNIYHQNNTPAQNSLYASFNTMLGSANVGLNVTKDDYISGSSSSSFKKTTEMRFGINVSIPFFKSPNTRFMNDFTSGSNVDPSNVATIFKHQNNTDSSFSVQSRLEDNSLSNSMSASINNRSRYGDFGIRGDWSKEQSRVNLSANGGIIAYEGGVLFTPQLGMTSAIVDFGLGAEGVKLNHDERSISNSQGVAVIPYVQPYVENIVNINTENSANVEIRRTPNSYVPRKGGIIYIKPDVLVGIRKIVSLNSDVNYFGGAVYDEESNERVSYVGVDNTIYLPGIIKNSLQRFYIGTDKKCIFEIDSKELTDKLSEVIYVECEYK